MTEPGTLYEFSARFDETCFIVMLVETKRLLPLRAQFLTRTETYEHSILLPSGKLEKIQTDTEEIEKDPYWKRHFKKVMEQP